MGQEPERFDYVRVIEGKHTGKIAEYIGIDREGTKHLVTVIADRCGAAIPFGALERAEVEDLDPTEATCVARDWIEYTQNPTWSIEFEDGELLDGEGGAGALVCARDEIDNLRLEPKVIGLLKHHSHIPAVAELLGLLLARNERVSEMEERSKRIRSIRRTEAWGSQQEKECKDPSIWLVDHGGLCP